MKMILTDINHFGDNASILNWAVASKKLLKYVNSEEGEFLWLPDELFESDPTEREAHLMEQLFIMDNRRQEAVMRGHRLQLKVNNLNKLTKRLATADKPPISSQDKPIKHASKEEL